MNLAMGASARLLTIKYITALSIIALLSLGAFFTTRQLIVDERTSAGTINLAGRQRMYSQRGVLLSLELAIEPNPAERVRLRAELRQMLDTMEDVHYAVISGSSVSGARDGLSPEMRAVMYENPVNLEAKLRHYIAAVSDLLALEDNELTMYLPQFAVIVSAADELIKAENEAVNQLQLESETRVKLLLKLETFLLVLTLLVLTLEGLFIFRPSARAIVWEQEKLAAANDELQRLSNQDGLTGIANRRFFDGYLAQMWRHAGRNVGPLSLLMADIDNFKLYNDTYGHQAGDECLRKVAKALQDQVSRETDLVARYGGEEFVIMLPHTGQAGAVAVAEKIRQAVEALQLEHRTSSRGIVTISLGTATTTPKPGGTAENLVALADKALYRAKERGRNRVESYKANETGDQ